MDMKLLANAVTKFALGLLLVAVLLFIPAGTVHFWNAWALICALFIPMFLAGSFMLFKAPELLRRRLNAREKQTGQKGLIALSGLMFAAAFVLAGLGYRFGWYMLPRIVSVQGVGWLLIGYGYFALVLMENEYLSRTVEIQEGQRVVDTGVYETVRHPMYSATLVIFLAMPVILGSVFSFVIMLGYIPIIAARIRGEEALLEQELEGYREYERKVRYRLIPHIW
ncbi:MAG: isoprenylcysteine carboxylmethyltransferase family protein [Oscillospiraceae bacterium]|nr:isoprenylcysteine carboxylmethyltransferase family protein [Oscillospiraceae bacterium]